MDSLGYRDFDSCDFIWVIMKVIYTSYLSVYG